MDSDQVVVFLSYAREDADRVGSLYDALNNAGFKPWMATRDILPGENWERSIWRAVRRADFFVACLSSRSVGKRGFLQKEIKQALDIWQEKLSEDIYLIPARLEGCEVPVDLAQFQWVDLFLEGGLGQLLRAVEIGCQRQGKVRTQDHPYRIVTVRLYDHDPDHRLYNVDVAYPQVQPEKPEWAKEINSHISGWVADLILSFRKQSRAAGVGEDAAKLHVKLPGGMIDDLSISYAVTLFTGDLLSIRFQVSTYGAGAAHPNHNVRTFSYFLEPTVLLDLSDLFEPGAHYMPALAALCSRALKAQAEEEGVSEEGWIEEGAAPEETKYKNFVLSDSALIVTFDPYQVGPYAWGIREVRIPYAKILNILKRGGPLRSQLL
jgi:hypothetical protein